jgi:hypothetical protein
MRKGTKKATIDKPVFSLEEVLKRPPAGVRYPLDPEVLDILTRICDACHEMDNRTEPWASIRKDIEKLR